MPAEARKQILPVLSCANCCCEQRPVVRHKQEFFVPFLEKIEHRRVVLVTILWEVLKPLPLLPHDAVQPMQLLGVQVIVTPLLAGAHWE